MRFSYLALSLILLLPNLLYGFDYVINLNKNINDSITYFVDENEKYDYKNILNDQSLFTEKVVNENMMLDANFLATWLKFDVNNNTDSEQKIYLSFFPSFIGNIQIFNGNDVFVGGAQVATPDENAHTTQIIDVRIKPGLNHLYALIKSKATSISVRAMSEPVFNSEKVKSMVIFFSLIGAIIVLAFYHLFFFISSRQKIYIYYIFYMFMLVLSQLSLTSYVKVIFPIEVANFPISYLGSLLFPSVAFFVFYLLGKNYLIFIKIIIYYENTYLFY